MLGTQKVFQNVEFLDSGILKVEMNKLKKTEICLEFWLLTRNSITAAKF